MLIGVNVGDGAEIWGTSINVGQVEELIGSCAATGGRAARDRTLVKIDGSGVQVSAGCAVGNCR